MTQSSDDAQGFLKEFFADGNAISWEQYETSAPTDQVRIALEPWVQRFMKQQSPFLLPRVDPASNLTSWYVLCTDPREARSMREALQAFIGATYAQFNGELAALDPADAIERLCESTFGSLVFRLPVMNPADRTQVGKLLSTLVEYRDRESNRSLAAIKPIGRLLRDLEMAILANNEQSAWAVYSEIRNRGRLSASNLAFLQVRIYGAFEHWAELLLLPNLNDLLQVRRPKRISELIAQAIYQQHFLKHETAGEAASAIDTYRSVGSRFQNLVRSTEGLQAPDAIKFALVAAVASEPPKRDLAQQLTQNPAIASDAAWSDALIATLPATENTEVVAESVAEYDVAEVRYNDNRFDEALALYLCQPHSRLSVSRVLETAVEVDSRKAAEDALAYLSAAPDDIGGQVLGRRVCANHIELLTRILGQDAEGEHRHLSSLSEWFEFVDEGRSLEAAGEILEYGIEAWISSASFNAASVAEQIQKNRTGPSTEVVRNAAPTLIKAILANGSPRREYKPVYSALTELLIYDESIGADDLTLVEQLTEAILTTVPSHETGNNDYAFAADVSVYLWDSLAAPRHFDWVLSMLDLLIDTGGQQHANLIPILASVANSCRAWARRVSDEQWSLLELLAGDLNLVEMINGLRPQPDESTNEAEPDIRGLFAGRSVAIYSITERIAKRAQQLIEQSFDDVTIHLLHDKCCTDRMKALAQSVDIFLVNTFDAKHAATNGIKDNRPSDQLILEPDSKSASAIYRSFLSLSKQG